MHGDIAPPPPSLAPTEVGWRPIESAPRDGTEIIVALPDGDQPSGYIVAAAHWVPHDDTGGDWWWANESSGDYYADSIVSSFGATPTHWMPLPPPPDNTPGVGGEGDRSAQSQPSGLPASQDSSGLGSEPSEAGDLASCPFCGSRGEEVGLCYEAGQTPAEGRDWFVRCYVCHVETAREDTAAEAIAAWNRRTASDWQSRPAPPQATLANKERQP